MSASYSNANSSNADSPTADGPKVLVFDMEAPLAEALAYTLTKNGYRPFTASSAKECLDLMQSAKPDLVLLDLLLPIEVGLAFCRDLCLIRDIPLILLTTQVSEADCIRGLELCADDYIVKPFSLGVLMARIGSVLRRSQRCQPSHLLIASDTALTEEIQEEIEQEEIQKDMPNE